MTIRNRLNLIVLFCAITFVAVMVAHTITEKKHTEHERAVRLVHESRETLGTLNILTSDYLQTRGKRAVRQWQVTEAEMERTLSGLIRHPIFIDSPRVKALQVRLSELRQLFNRLIAIPTPELNRVKLSQQNENILEQELSAHLLLTAREMLTTINTMDAEQSSLAVVLHKDEQRLENMIFLLMLSLALGILVWIYKALWPLRLLQRGAQAIGRGDYDEKIEINSKDELADVADSFIAMRDIVQEKIESLTAEVKEREEAEKNLKEKQAQLDHAGRLTALGEMATGIAHEINQPLAIIGLANEVLKEYFAKHKDVSFENEAVHGIEEQINRASNIITNMRTFARANPNPVLSIDITEPLNIALSFFREQFRLHDIELHTSIAESLLRVKIDPQKFEQIVVNLLSNARYAVEKREEDADGSYQKTIAVTLSSDFERKMVTFEIHDNGIGMSEEACKRCLEPFFTMKEVGQGTGLGLTIVHTIVTEFKGRIEIKSTEGEGTLFQIFFPAGDEE